MNLCFHQETRRGSWVCERLSRVAAAAHGRRSERRGWTEFVDVDLERGGREVDLEVREDFRVQYAELSHDLALASVRHLQHHLRAAPGEVGRVRVRHDRILEAAARSARLRFHSPIRVSFSHWQNSRGFEVLSLLRVGP